MEPKLVTLEDIYGKETSPRTEQTLHMKVYSFMRDQQLKQSWNDVGLTETTLYNVHIVKRSHIIPVPDYVALRGYIVQYGP